MSIILLYHHVHPVSLRWDEGHFGSWAHSGLPPTMKAVQQHVTPQLKTVLDFQDKPLYDFLTRNPKQKHEFEKRWLECYVAFLEGEYLVIPDYDQETGWHNKDYLCEACPTWERVCQYRRVGENKQI